MNILLFILDNSFKIEYRYIILLIVYFQLSVVTLTLKEMALAILNTLILR